MQGALLTGAQLKGASLRSPFVWRADARNASDAVAVSAEPLYIDARRACEKGEIRDKDRLCTWSEASFDALKRHIREEIPVYVDKLRREGALKRIDPKWNPDQRVIDDIA
jgi:hypothetical protein